MDGEKSREGEKKTGIKVQKSILERIEQLNTHFKQQGGKVEHVSRAVVSKLDEGRTGCRGGEDAAPSSAADGRSTGQPKNACADGGLGTASVPAEGRHTAGGEISVWDVSEDVKMIGQCWNNETEPFSKRNNLAQVEEHLEKSYRDRYMVYLFGDEKRTDVFKRSQRYDLGRFSMETCLELVQSAKCWFDICPGGKIIVEMQKGKEPVILFVICCLLSYLREAVSAEVAYHNLLKDGTLPLLWTETAFRYVRYFDLLFGFRASKKFPVILLNQVIITTIPPGLAQESCSPVLVIREKNSETRMEENYYKDDNFIIFSGIDKMVSGDAEIVLLSKQEKSEHRVFGLPINTYFYQEGLYRFTGYEVEDSRRSTDRARSLGDGFFLDLIFTESGNREREYPFALEPNAVHGLKIISDHMQGGFPKERLNAFLDNNFNRILAKFCAQMDLTVDEGTELVKRLERLGCYNLVYRATPVQVTQVEEPGENAQRGVDLQKPYVELAYTIDYGSKGCAEAKDIELIQDTVIKKANMARSGLRSFVKKRGAAVQEEPPALVAVKPLHWIPLTDTEETIFNEMKDVDAEIDFERLENAFCEPLKSEIKKATSSKQNGHISDSRRLFLASLSIKHLERKNIVPATLPQIIADRPEFLTVQDLLNLERAFPTGDELDAMGQGGEDRLCAVERTMFEFSKIKDVQKVVQILIFERRFCEEIGTYQQVLSDLLLAFNKILDSNGLKTILKTVLNIGNAINYKYSLRRKKADGYKLESLYIFNTYVGKHNTTLFSFLMDTLKKNNVAMETLFAELRLVHKVKNEEMARVKQKVNDLILLYRERLAIFETLDQEEKARYQRVLGYACKTLIEISQKYKECNIHSSIIKRKFGEDEKNPVNGIFTVLSDFLEKLESEGGV